MEILLHQGLSGLKEYPKCVWLFILLLALSSCSPEISKVSLPYDSLDHFSASGNQRAHARWWTHFGDTVLNRLIDSALVDNLPLEATWQQFQAANAVLNQSRSNLFPQVDLSLRSGISRPKPDFVGGENTQLSLGASYELDLWGRIRYATHAQQYRSEASRFDYKAAAVSLSGELALTWFRLKAALQQLQLVREQIKTNEQTLALIRVRFGSGQVRGVDILRQQQLIASTEEQKIILETNIATLQNQLSILLGDVPKAYVLDSLQQRLPGLPPLPDTGVPLKLVNRRPDVESAYYQLQAADREVAVAISAKYPRINLSLAAAIRSNDINDLLQSQAVSLTGSILQPLFYGGRLSAAVDEAEAIREQQISLYAQTVLIAFQEVENALIQEQKQRERISIVEERLDLAQKANSQLKIEYLNGSLPYLDVLTGLSQAQQLQRELVGARLNLLELRIALYRALAGGFETEREKQEDQS